MKRIKLISSILTLVIGVAALSYGVYAAKSITAIANAQVKFTSDHVFATMTAQFTGAYDDQNAAKTGAGFATANSYTSYTANGAALTPTALAETFAAGTIYFNNAARTDLVLTITVANDGGNTFKTKVTGGEDNTTTGTGWTMTSKIGDNAYAAGTEIEVAAGTAVTFTFTYTKADLASSIDNFNVSWVVDADQAF